MKKIIITTILSLFAIASFAQTSFTLNGRKINIKGKLAGTLTLNATYKATYQDFYEIIDKKNIVVNNVQIFLDEPVANNKDVVTYTLSVADIDTDFLEDRMGITEDAEHTSFKENAYEVRLHPKDGKVAKASSWGRSDKAGDTPNVYDDSTVRIAFADLKEAQAFLKLLRELTK